MFNGLQTESTVSLFPALEKKLGLRALFFSFYLLVMLSFDQTERHDHAIICVGLAMLDFLE
jgi:hypothetical protein